MLTPRLFTAWLVMSSLLLVVMTTAAPFEQDFNDDHFGLSYDTYRYKRGEEWWPTEKMRDVPKTRNCGKGEYFEPCLPCAIGYYKPRKAKKRCAKCGSTKGTPNVGATWCTNLCKAGEKLLNDAPNAKRNCTKCEIGSYQPAPSVSFDCILCPDNKTTAREGSKHITDCYLNCPAGMQQNSAGLSCEYCPAGTYKRNAGGSKCTACDNGTTPFDGATGANQCKQPCDPGKEYNKTSGRCNIRCDSGTYKPETSSRTKCRECPENFVPNKRRAATKCEPKCGPGFELNGMKNNCTACKFGYFKADTGNTNCEPCPGNQLTLSKGTTNSDHCKDINACAKPLVTSMESLFGDLEGMMLKSNSFIEFMTDVCSCGPNDTYVGLLESIVAGLQTCGVVGQMDLEEVLVGDEWYKKVYYLKIFQDAFNYGGMCSFVNCLMDAVTEIQKSKYWIKFDTCLPSESKCFCSDSYRALATSFQTNLKTCPALQFHKEFLNVEIGGPEMIESLFKAANITEFSLSNECVSVDCGFGSCSSQFPGGYRCKCWLGYAGEHCRTAQPIEQETEPETKTARPEQVMTSPTHCECPSMTTTSCPECPSTPVSATCPPTTEKQCPTCTPCPACQEPTLCTTKDPMEHTTHSSNPVELVTPTPQTPTSTPLICPTFSCADCPTLPPTTPCPLQSECPTTINVSCPVCPTTTTTTIPGKTLTPSPCPACPCLDATTMPLPTRCPTPTECPTTTDTVCPVCPTTPPPIPCPTSTPTPCPTCSCPECANTPPQMPIPTSTPVVCPICSCPECPTSSTTSCPTSTTTECPTCPSCPEYSSTKASTALPSESVTCDCSTTTAHQQYGPAPLVDITNNHKRVIQSSEYPSRFAANLAVDDSKSTFSHTGIQTNPSWSLEFCSEVTVAKVTLRTRSDCCDYQMSDVSVYVDGVLCGHVDGLIGVGNTVEITCQIPLVGRVVKVQRYVQYEASLSRGISVLSMADVHVFSPTKTC